MDSQGRAPTPCSGLDADPNTDLEMMMLGDSAQLQLPDGFDWPRAAEMALDQLPDSDLRHRPEYQLTQEWLEKITKCLEIDEEKWVAAEREVVESAEIGADMETG